jgi:hypothetical protein
MKTISHKIKHRIKTDCVLPMLQNLIFQDFKNVLMQYAETEHASVLFLCNVKGIQIAFIQLGYLRYYKLNEYDDIAWFQTLCQREERTLSLSVIFGNQYEKKNEENILKVEAHDSISTNPYKFTY